MAERLTRPKSFDVGPLKVRPHRRPIDSNPHWSWRITTKGRGFQVLTSGRWTEEEAAKKAAEILAAGFRPAPKETEDGKPETIGDLLAVYAAGTYVGSTRHVPSTLRNVKRCMKHIRRIIGDVPLAGVTRDTIARYVKAREAEGRAPSTIKKEWVVLAQAWKYGRESLWVSGELPHHGIESETRVYNHRTPTLVEILQVIDHLKDKANSRKNGAQWPWMALEIARHTGARVGTIEKIRVRDFWVEASGTPPGRLRLFGKRTKKNKTGERVIPIPDELVTTIRSWLLLRGRPDAGERLLGVKGKIVRSRGRDKLVDACEALEIEPFTWHGVRRFVVRDLRRRGMSTRGAAAFLGHSPTVMLRIYDEIDDGDLADEAARVWASR